MDLPEVAILICTYNRFEEIKKTIFALRENIKYGGQGKKKITFVVADDSTGGDYLDKLSLYYRKQCANSWGSNCFNIKFISTPTRSGWGANVNNGMRYIQSDLGIDYVYFTEDDYILTKPLDLTLGIKVLENRQDVALLRYDGIVGHRVICKMDEVRPIPNTKHGMNDGETIFFWDITPASPALNIYSNRPHLKSISRFHGFYGWYPEGLSLGHTEESFAHTVKDNLILKDAPKLATLPEWVLRAYDDIGISFQNTEYDKETIRE